MARQSLWNRVLGAVGNAALPGSPYNKYTGWNPTLTRNSIISGAVGQLNPIAGGLTQQFLGNTPGAQSATAGNQGISGLMGLGESSNAAYRGDFDSSGIQAEFAPIAPMDFTGYDPTNPQTAPQPQQQGAQQPQTLAGLAVSGPKRDTRTGNSTRSGVLAEGAAAQDMVEGMKLGNWLGMKAPTGPGRQYTRQA